jgi:hypothetical protein
MGYNSKLFIEKKKSGKSKPFSRETLGLIKQFSKVSFKETIQQDQNVILYTKNGPQNESKTNIKKKISIKRPILKQMLKEDVRAEEKLCLM